MSDLEQGLQAAQHSKQATLEAKHALEQTIAKLQREALQSAREKKEIDCKIVELQQRDREMQARIEELEGVNFSSAVTETDVLASQANCVAHGRKQRERKLNMRGRNGRCPVGALSKILINSNASALPANRR